MRGSNESCDLKQDRTQDADVREADFYPIRIRANLDQTEISKKANVKSKEGKKL